jgi:hypothetical protein
MNEAENKKPSLSKLAIASWVVLFVCMLIAFLSRSDQEPRENAGKSKEEWDALTNIIAQQDPASRVWGEEVKGIRSAVEFLPEKNSYSTGEKINTLIWIQNTRGHSISMVKKIGHLFYCQSVITGIEVNSPIVSEVRWIENWKSNPDKMEAGESRGCLGPEIDIMDFEKDITYPPQKTPNIIYLFPGRYMFSFKLDCSSKLTLETGKRILSIEPNNQQ